MSISMDPRSILDKNGGEAARTPDTSNQSIEEGQPGNGIVPEKDAREVRFPAEDGGRSLADMAKRDLDATLQLLVERAQYITASTGAAIALRNGEGMVCRASAGSAAPEVGAELQVNSGLSGESVRTRQTLRCDDALVDERVNRESCEALGIRSVVVMPLLEGDEVIGVFELFSDQANVFEARDITALERMATMVHAALEQSIAVPGSSAEPETKAAAAEPAAETPATSGESPAGEEKNQAPEPIATPAPPIADPAAQSSAPSMTDLETLAASKLGPQTGIAFHRRIPVKESLTAAVPSSPSEAPPESPEVSPETASTAAAPDNTASPASEAPGATVEEPSTDTPKLANENEGLTPPVAAQEAQEAAPISPVEPEEKADVPQSTGPSAAGAPEGQNPETSTDVVTEEKDDAATTKENGNRTAEEVAGGAPKSSAEHATAETPASHTTVAGLRKCEACGFPVSEGRQLCLDCEKKKKQVATTSTDVSVPGRDTPSTKPAPVSAPQMPHFLNDEEEEPSWLAAHKLMVVAIVIAIILIVTLMLVR